MANTVASQLLISEIADVTLTALKRHLLPLRAFATAFDANLQGNDYVEVPYYPLHAAASVERAAGDDYFDHAANTTTDVKRVQINKNVTQVLAYTAEERARKPILNPERLGQQAAERLSFDLILDILSLATTTNFTGDTIAPVAAADFDFESMQDLRTKATTARWPKMGRSVILNPAFFGNLFKSGVGLNVQQAGGIYGEGEVARVAGFDVHEFADMPANADDIAGIAVYQSAILAGFAPIRPTAAMQAQMFDYQEFTDPETGLVIQYMHLAKAYKKQEAQVFEIHYGRAVGEVAALLPIQSA